MRDVTFHKQYACVVQRQDSNGLLDLLPDDKTIRGTGLSSIPIRHGLPGFTVQVQPGSRVLLAFENGDPEKPFASLWAEATVLAVSFGSGTRPIARVGDEVQVFFPTEPMPITGTVSGNPFVGTILITTPGSGMIISGRAEFQA